MNHNRRPCPVCDSLSDRRIIYHQSFVGETAVGSGYDVVVCVSCGSGFADGVPSQNEFDRYYKEQSKYEYTHNEGAESPYDFKRFAVIVEQVISLVPRRDAAVLDVGCATGGLLATFAKLGYTNLRGSDPSPGCAAAARRLHGIEVDIATIEQLGGSTKRFDVILLVGVLEHLREVVTAVALLKNLLKPSGILYCAQPDVEAFKDCVNAPYQQFSTEHVNFFSRVSVTRLLSVAGLTPRATWQWMVEWREGITDSVISIASVAGEGGQSPDEITGPSLNNYIEISAAQERKIVSSINELVRSQRPLIVWGVGTFTRHLLASTSLANANIVGFVDSNRNLARELISGRKVLQPEQCKNRPEAILVCSIVFEREIVRMIQEKFNLYNPVLTFSRLISSSYG